MNVNKTNVLRYKYLLNGKEVDDRAYKTYNDIIEDGHIRKDSISYKNYVQNSRHDIHELIGKLYDMNIGCRDCDYSTIETVPSGRLALVCNHESFIGCIVICYSSIDYDLSFEDGIGPIGCLDMKLNLVENHQCETTLKGFQLF